MKFSIFPRYDVVIELLETERFIHLFFFQDTSEEIFEGLNALSAAPGVTVGCTPGFKYEDPGSGMLIEVMSDPRPAKEYAIKYSPIYNGLDIAAMFQVAFEDHFGKGRVKAIKVNSSGDTEELPQKEVLHSPVNRGYMGL